MKITITLGEPVSGKEASGCPELRHENDLTWEVLADCDDEGYSLGWLTSVHDLFTGKISYWYLFGPEGDALPGIRGNYGSKKGALDAAMTWTVRALTGRDLAAMGES